MRFKILLTVLMLLICSIMNGQITEIEDELREDTVDSLMGWHNGGSILCNLGQTSMTNWSAGGENSVSLSGFFSVYANFKGENSIWDNYLDIGYGILKHGKNTDHIKTDDKFDFLTKYGQKATEHLYYAGLVNFRSQMTEGKDYSTVDTAKISDILAPAYILGAVGLDYKPNDGFGAFIAPVTSKLTIVNDQNLANGGAFGVEGATYDDLGNVIKKGEKIKSEFGGYIRAIYKKSDFRNEILKNISFTTKLDLFSNYAENPQNIDVNWETQTAMHVNKFISVNIFTHLIYDDRVMILDDGKLGPRTQFKEILGVGFAYKF